MKKIVFGNSKDVGSGHRGWIAGWFMDEVPELQTSQFEIKWAEHNAGDKKQFSGTNETAKSLCVLVEGKVKFFFENENQELLLENKGDYVYWDSGVSHSWEFLTDGLTFVVRWPSLPNDQKEAK